MIIQFNSHLFECQLNSPRVNYRVSTNEENKQSHKEENKAIYNILVMIIE
jgi:hypothetical protein